MKLFGDDRIEELKRKNDWNMNIDIDKCEKVKIVRRKKRKGPVKMWADEEFYKKAVCGDPVPYLITFFKKDDYNRSMYIGNGKYCLEERKQRRVIMFFQPDGSYDEKNGVMELKDLNNYQDDLKAFKERNNWNVKP